MASHSFHQSNNSSRIKLQSGRLARLKIKVAVITCGSSRLQELLIIIIRTRDGCLQEHSQGEPRL